MVYMVYTVPYGIYGTIWYGMVWYGTIWYIPYHMVYVVYMVPMVTYGIYDRYL